jgi:threonine synthase
MQYYSTNKQSPKVDFKEATIQGQPPDKGLYFPEKIPAFANELLSNIRKWSNQAIAFQIIKPYVGNAIPPVVLDRIISETISFDFPLVDVDENISCLELFHGPTLAFKDVGARFMSRCLGYFVKGMKKQVTVLVATSGDTGGAVANGFLDVEGVNVFILYPSGKVSKTQELQLTTNGKNIKSLEVTGSFDDCQQLVKQAFADPELTRQLFLTSANSINVARWLPQQFYYAFALKQWKHKSPPVVAVPSGNFGNLCAGLLAFRSGLPIKHFIAACNANDAVPHYFQTGKYEPKQAIATLSNAMDVGNPSNFIRILELFNHELKKLQSMITSYSISDETTKQVIKQVYANNSYLLDPHGAVGYISLREYLRDHPDEKGFFLGTAHPVKFHDAIEPLIQEDINLPLSIEQLKGKEKNTIKMSADFSALKEILMRN